MNRDYIEKLIFPYTLSQIKYFKSNKNTTIVLFIDGTTIKLGYHLGRLEKQLKSIKCFKRVHESYLINLCFVTFIDIPASYLKLLDKEPIPFTHIYKKNFFDLLPEIITKKKMLCENNISEKKTNLPQKFKLLI